MHVTELVAVGTSSTPVRPRTGVFLLIGLTVSGWIGFLVLAGVLLATRNDGAPVATTDRAQARAEPDLAGSKPGSTVTPEETPSPQLLAEPQRLSIVTRFEERRRMQERMQEADVSDHQHGNLGAARQVYAYVAAKGWASAALALAFTHDPHELLRRGMMIPPNADKARACYIKARKLMNAAVAYYLSRLPSGQGAACGA